MVYTIERDSSDLPNISEENANIEMKSKINDFEVFFGYRNLTDMKIYHTYI
jgi:hypothetical protein